MQVEGSLAQRRPGPRPRRHCCPPRVPVLLAPRSTKAGAETPATRQPAARGRRGSGSLNEGRGRDPGDTASPAARSTGSASLNEGRGRDPGDTANVSNCLCEFSNAQRRPGPRPRRHCHHGSKVTTLFPVAQRRPGPRLRRHGDGLRRARGRQHRSTKAGAETPATRPAAGPGRSGSGALNEGRGRDPGDTWPEAAPRCPWAPLNEGRGRDPGDTARSPGHELWRTPLNEGRGRDPGDTGCRWSGRPGCRPLNEGRGRDPGDTRPTRGLPRAPGASLNEGRGRDPGDTARCARAWCMMRSLNEGRGRDPGDTRTRGK